MLIQIIIAGCLVLFVSTFPFHFFRLILVSATHLPSSFGLSLRLLRLSLRLSVHCRCTRPRPPAPTPQQHSHVRSRRFRRKRRRSRRWWGPGRKRSENKQIKAKKRSAHLRRRAPTGRKCAGPRVDQVAAMCSDTLRVCCRSASRRHSLALLRARGCATVSAAECADDAVHSFHRPLPLPAAATRTLLTPTFLHLCLCCALLVSLRYRVVRSRRITIATPRAAAALRLCLCAPLDPLPLHSSLPFPPPSGGFGGGRGGGRGGAAGGRGGFGGRVNEHAHNAFHDCGFQSSARSRFPRVFCPPAFSDPCASSASCARALSLLCQ